MNPEEVCLTIARPVNPEEVCLTIARPGTPKRSVSLSRVQNPEEVCLIIARPKPHPKARCLPHRAPRRGLSNCHPPGAPFLSPNRKDVCLKWR
jgi:hypothetical protein